MIAAVARAPPRREVLRRVGVGDERRVVAADDGPRAAGVDADARLRTGDHEAADPALGECCTHTTGTAASRARPT
jgi:hypothetical protein